MKLYILSLLSAYAAAFTPSSFHGRSSVGHVSSSKASMTMETGEDLTVLAKKLNPVVGFFDPMDLSSQSFWDTTPEATIGFLRESEIKHGRIAMFAFVGYIVHANGITFPWSMQMDGTPFPKVASAPEAWDAIPEAAKLQIFAFIGFLEYWREVASETHYMKGGKPGDFPDFDSSVIPGGALNFYDPLRWHADRTEAEKEDGLLKELNNGRLAMIGILGFLAEGKLEGSVPALKGIIPAYAGEPMAPFAESIFPSISL